jgi:hypothetical protein
LKDKDGDFMAQLKDTTVDGNLEIIGDIHITNAKSYRSYNAEGEIRTLLHMNASNNTLLGYGGYSAGEGGTYIYGNDVYIVSKEAGSTKYKPYYSAGDSITMTLYTAGFVTSAGASIRFLVPLSKPIIGNPTITITSGAGLTLRQGTKYTHGSSSTASVKPSKYETIGDTDCNGIAIVATMSDTTNVTNNDTLGIYWNGTITFS